MLSDATMNDIIDRWHAALPDFAKTGTDDLERSKVYLRGLCRATAEAEARAIGDEWIARHGFDKTGVADFIRNRSAKADEKR